jgi:pilus assembly protein CpaC
LAAFPLVPVVAQDPACTTVSGFPLPAAPVPQQGPRPLTGPDSVPSFVDSLSNNDGAFEVVVSQGRILTLKEDLAKGKGEALIAVGDPTVIDFVVINPRQIRVIGERIGVTDLSVTTSAGRSYNFEVRVVADLNVLRGQLSCLFPDARLKLGQIRDLVVVEGQARDTAQVSQIINTIQAYLTSIQISQARRVAGPAGRPAGTLPLPGAGQLPAPVPSDRAVPPGATTPVPPALVSPETGAGSGTSTQATIGPPAILNLIRVPGSHQVLLKVRVAEMNRTALRQIGADWLAVNPSTGATVGTQIGGNTVSSTGTVALRQLLGVSSISSSPTTTAFGIFEAGDFEVFVSALRRNNILKILAEPNLVALNGMLASFLAGGEFPVPVPQFGGQGGAAATVTVQFKEFGVRLAFVPYILDGEVVRLSVDPEVSEIDFSVATTLVPGGSPVPGVSTRRTHTTVEMRQGQTLMISGLLQLTLTAQTSRIPGLGDLPVLGPFFSNTSSTRTEKELVVLVTPYLVEPMNPGQVPPTPGDEVKEPNDLELYLLNRIEARTGRDFRATTKWDDVFHFRDLLHLESKYFCGQCGFTD